MVNFAFNSRKEVLVVSVILITLCFLPVINAEIQTLGTFKQGECLDLKQVAANFTYCNITSIQYPNSTYTIIDNVMYQRGTDYNYTFCNTSSLGQYIVNGVCTDSSTETVWAYDFDVTMNGAELSTGRSILYLIFLLASSGIFVLCLYWAINLPFKNQRNDEEQVIGINWKKYLKLFLIPITYMMGMFIVGLLRGIVTSFSSDIGIDKFFSWIYWMMMTALWPLIVMSIIFGFICFVMDKKFLEAIGRGLPEE